MTKTKRTVEETEVAAAAAANSDSKLITKGGLNSFATKFWTKIKEKYNVSFKDVTLTADKKLKFTKIEGANTVDIDLVDYAKLTDKSEFKQDVSADNVAILSNDHIGNSVRFDSQNRSLGFRQLTTSAFVDGYVDHIRIYLEDNATENATFKVWAIKKDANGREGDRVSKVINLVESLKVNSVGEGSAAKKFVIIPIKQAFADETYFIVRCSTHKVKVVDTIKPKYAGDAVNLNDEQPPESPDSGINWGANADNANTAIMYLYGRESIGSLALKLNKVSPDSGLYVKHSETTDTGGTRDTANKVVKLDNDGKLNKNMLPSIAINEYFTVTEFTNDALQNLGHFENGDVVVVSNDGVVTKRYLCVDKEHNTNNLIKGFVELNSKEGMVQSVNGKNGAVTLALEAAADELKLKITGGEGAADVTSVPIVTEGDINSIIEGLRD